MVAPRYVLKTKKDPKSRQNLPQACITNRKTAETPYPRHDEALGVCTTTFTVVWGASSTPGSQLQAGDRGTPSGTVWCAAHFNTSHYRKVTAALEILHHTIFSP